MQGLRYDSRFYFGLGSLNYGVETIRVGNSDFAQHFSVQPNIGFFAGVDELTVSYTPLPTGCV